MRILDAIFWRKRVPGFHLCRKIGTGGYGNVYEAKQINSAPSKTVAVKVVRVSNVQGLSERMEHEANMMQQAGPHENIVELVTTVKTKEYACLVMQLCRGGDLHDLICKQQKLDEATARSFARQILLALVHLHSHGVAHRDVKPENVMISEDGLQVLLGDFGFATTEPLCTKRCGTLDYAAPELVNSHVLPYDPKKVDTWGCGVVLFCMLTGAHPFTDATPRQTAENIQKGVGAVHSLTSKLSPHARNLLGKLLESDPNKRLTAEEALAHPFFSS